MTADHSRVYFGDYSLDVTRGALQHQGKDVKLRPKSFKLLSYLVERHGELISKEELLEAIWGQAVVTDDAVTQCIIDCRRAIGDEDQKMIRTVPRRGYLFDLPVSHEPAAGQAVEETTGAAPSNRVWLIAAAIAVVAVVAIWQGLVDNTPNDAEPTVVAGAGDNAFVAVLPFLDMSPAQDQEYFADGVSEELLNALTRVPNLRVMARTSSFSFRNSDDDVASIARKLGVSHVIEGSVRKSGDTLRVTVQLIDSSTSEHVWSEIYDRTLDDAFSVQDDISRDVARRLRLSLLTESEPARLPQPEAYRLYLQAKYLLDNMSMQHHAEIAELLERSIALNDQFAPAWRELGRVRWRQIGNGPDVREDIRQTKYALDQGLAINPNDAGLLAYYAWHVADFYGDLEQSARQFKRAIELEPHNEDVVRSAQAFASGLADPDVAIAIGEYGIDGNPLCYPCRRNLIHAYILAGRLDEARKKIEETKVFFEQAAHLEGLILILEGKPAEALPIFEQEDDEERKQWGRALALFDLGRIEEADQALLGLTDSKLNFPFWRRAQVYAWFGRNDEAFRELEASALRIQIQVDRQLVRHNLVLVGNAVRSPIFSRIHADPRWEEFRQRLGVSEQQLANVLFDVNLPTP